MRTSSAAATAFALALLAGGCGSSDTQAPVETFFHGTVDETSALSVSRSDCCSFAQATERSSSAEPTPWPSACLATVRTDRWACGR